MYVTGCWACICPCLALREVGEFFEVDGDTDVEFEETVDPPQQNPAPLVDTNKNPVNGSKTPIVSQTSAPAGYGTIPGPQRIPGRTTVNWPLPSDDGKPVNNLNSASKAPEEKPVTQV